MINFNWVVISGDNRGKILYILSLLNSKVNQFVALSLIKSDHEKDVLIGIRTIKEFIRIPKITKKNQYIKDEIIRQTEELLKLEEIRAIKNYIDDLVFALHFDTDIRNIGIEHAETIKNQCRKSRFYESVIDF